MMADLPSPPFIKVEGVHNFRDIGEAPVSSTTKVTPGVLFRSADPSNATEAGLLKLKELGITHVFDLRSSVEITRDTWHSGKMAADPEATSEEAGRVGIRRCWTPVFADDDYTPGKLALRYRQYASSGSEGFTKAYGDILRAGAPAFSKIFLHLAHAASPCLVHCTAGKDRTGVFIALVLSLIGCSDEAVAKEYALTDLGLAERKPFFAARLLETEEFKVDPKGVENMVGARAENMMATLAMIREQYGSAEDVLKNMCSLTEDDIQKIKSRLVMES